MENIVSIVYYSEVIDNWGRTESSKLGHNIYSMLSDSSNWSDDVIFEDSTGKKYFIDDLIGKQVHVPDIGVFTVPEEE